MKYLICCLLFMGCCSEPVPESEGTITIKAIDRCIIVTLEDTCEEIPVGEWREYSSSEVFNVEDDHSCHACEAGLAYAEHK